MFAAAPGAFCAVMTEAPVPASKKIYTICLLNTGVGY